MFSTRLRALSVFVVLAAAGSGLLLAQSPQEVGTWVGVGTADNPFGNGAHVDVGDGHTLIVGGTAPDGTATNVVANFDTATNQFAIAGTLLSARTGHTATLLKDGRVLVTGGTTNSLVSTDIEVFDPSTGSSTLVAQMAEPRRGHVAGLLQNGNVLIAGGYTSGDVVLQSAFIFDPATNSISPTPGGLNVARASASATSLIDGNVVVVGGTDGTNDLKSAEIFNPFSQSFSIVSTQLSVPVRGHSAVLLPNNGSVLIAGGTSNGAVQAGADLFLPAEFPDPFSWGVGQFAPTAAMSAARSSAISGPTATEGYAVATGGGSNDVERYRFATIKTDKDDYPPGQTAIITGTGWQPGEQVTLLFQEDPAVHDDYVLTVTADAQGNIFHDQWAPEEHDLNVRFYLLASGQISHRKAQMTFTDSRTATAGDVPDKTVVAGELMTASVTVETAGNGATDDWSSTRWTFSDPALTTGCANTANHNEDGTFTESFSPVAPPTIGTFSVTFTPFQSEGCAGGGGVGNANNPVTVSGIGVSQASTTTAITSDTPDPSVVGQAVTVQAQVSPVAPSIAPINQGTVTINATGGLSCTTGTVVAGVASCQITFPTIGAAKTITATYNGTANYSGSTSADATHVVTAANTTTAITADTPDPSVTGQAVTVQVQVSPVAPSTGLINEGTVTILASPGGLSCTTGTVAAGVASCQITFPTAGAKTISANYDATANYLASTSANETHTVSPASTTTVINSDLPDPSNVGQAVTVQVTVAAVAPGAGPINEGAVTVSAADAAPCTTSTLVAGAGSCVITFTASGAKTITATYNALANYVTSTSAGEPHTVNLSNIPPTIAVTYASVMVDEGTEAKNEGTWSDANAADIVALSASVGTVTKDGNGPGTWTWSFNTADGPAQSQTVTITANDGNGGISQTTFSLTVNNVEPTAIFSNNGPISEGGSATISFTNQADVSSLDTTAGFKYAYSCDGSAISVTTYAAAGGSASTSCAFNDNGSMLVRGRIFDKDSGYRDYQTTVTVNNVAPTATLSNNGPIFEGGSATISFSSPFDPSGEDTAAGFKYAYSCGPAITVTTYAAATTDTNTSCAFDDNGSMLVHGRIFDKDDGYRDYDTTVTVNNVAPTATLSNNGPVFEGSPVTITFTGQADPSSADTTAGFRYAYSCNELIPIAATTYLGAGTGTSASTSCTFGDNGSMKVLGRIFDKDNGYRDYETTVTVNNVAPTGTPNPLSFNPYTGVASASIGFSDVGWLDKVKATFNWAGTQVTSSEAAAGGGPGPVIGTINGSYTFTGCVAGAISVHLSDDDGGLSPEYQLAAANTLGVYTARFMAPIKDGARNIVKLGNVIPVKIEVLDCHGNPVLNRTLTVSLVTGTSPEEILAGDNFTEGASVSSADNGNQMRIADGHYMFNLATKGLKTGVPFTILIRDTALGTQNIATAAIELKK